MNRIAIATALGEQPAGKARQLARSAGAARRIASARSRWHEYWRQVPAVKLPDPVLQEAWEYGLYKQAGLSCPCGVAATLQGPWMEACQVPPWSNDYHFNINVQMIYWPVLATGQWNHFDPLWRMIRTWMPVLRENGRRFFNNEHALMLPHAVDDRCAVMGGFWTGTVDHACTAWIARMAWLHYRYSMDEAVLRELAWPLLNGAFEGYWSMLEEKAGRLALPVSVSPEFKGARMDAWGADASFQLAACHMVCADLRQAAGILGEPPDPRWKQVSDNLPPYTTLTASATREHPDQMIERIALWAGMDLVESHRHHSHLACIYPFATIDPLDSRHREVIRQSVFHWIRTGTGAWSGWSFPRAATLCARLDMADAAVALIRLWRDAFTNEGRGTLHDPAFTGISSIGFHKGLTPDPDTEIMQADAGMGVLTAITELLVQCRADGLHVLPSIPMRWRDLQFDGIRTEGGFLIGATVTGGRLMEVRVQVRHAGRLRLHHGLGETWMLNGISQEGPVLDQMISAGEFFLLTAVA